LLQRDAAERYLFLTLVSFAASVSLTRLFLSIANYPQIGGGDVHIAHVLWGGLLLYVSAILPLLFANRAVYTVGAIMAGTGVGLFIDEIGKFITKQNDYFFPIAASLIYVVFLLTLVAFLHIRRLARTRQRDELTRVFEDLWEAQHHTLTPSQYARLKQRLEYAAHSASTEGNASLAGALLAYLEANAAPESAGNARPRKSSRPVRRIVGRVFSENTLRVILILGLIGVALLSWKNPVTVFLGPYLPTRVASGLANLHLGRHIEASTPGVWPSIRLGLEILVGLLLMASAVLLMAKQKRLGSALGYVGLLLSLTTVDILLFYYEQFSTIITTSIQFALWIGIIIYRRHKA
jgi:hypothetical protein